MTTWEPSPPGGGAGVDDAYPVRFPVVAMVASAGGLAVLTRILELLPPDLPASTLIALHQAPDRPSELVYLLGRTAKLSVRVAQDGAPLVIGQVLVAPPGRHLLVTSSARIGLIATGAPPRPSADLLLATLAVTCGTRALAVVLTGYGHDGQAGVRAIAHCGGAVIAQDRSSSAQFGMPGAAIDTEAVTDGNILPPDGIAKAIIDHVRQLRPAESDSR